MQNTILWGYEGRNPLDPNTVSTLNELAPHFQQTATAASHRFQSKVHGFSVFGVSGIGKTTTVENILSRIPQVFLHSEYKGIPMKCRQVTWLKIDCPGDGSIKHLCKSYFQAMDHVLGTSYESRYKHCTVDDMLVGMNRVSFTENLGVLILDEIQHLCSADKKVSERVLNFIVSLVNTTGVPVVFIGTTKAQELFQQDFQQARRASAQGDFTWESFEEGAEWDRYLKALWPYQYTGKVVPLTPQISHALYEESFGNQALTAILYKLVQEDAILREEETFGPADIHRVARTVLNLTQKMRKSFQTRQDVDIGNVVNGKKPGFTDQSAKNAAEAAETAANQSGKKVDRQTLIQNVASGLTMFGLSYPNAVMESSHIRTA